MAHADEPREEIRKQRTHVRPHTRGAGLDARSATVINLTLKFRNEILILQYPILVNLVNARKKFAIIGILVRRRTDSNSHFEKPSRRKRRGELKGEGFEETVP